MPPSEQTAAVPAQLSLLAIYNPSLGATDETLLNQIVFYYPKSKDKDGRRSRRSEPTSDTDNQENQAKEHEKLRQIGLAQGLVSFAKNFSNGELVDTVETEKCRIVLHELEEGWWILARINLSRLPPGSSGLGELQANSPAPFRAEYSSREVAPSYLIRQQLVRAHSIFLLHHAQSLNDLYARLPRETFCGILERFWSRFIWKWDILLNGNPMVDILNGIKVAEGGELGIGVGEEEWGSGEREVLEGFIARTPGLANIIVSKFGEGPPADHGENKPSEADGHPKSKYSWIGCDRCPGPSDGVIFSGIGTISRSSLAQVSHWMEWIYRYGEDAYGVREDPMTVRRRKKRKVPSIGQPKGRSESRRNDPGKLDSALSTPRGQLSPGIPPPLVVSTGHRTRESKPGDTVGPTADSSPPKNSSDAYSFGTETFMKLLTLGYGSAWGNTSSNPPSHPRVGLLQDGDKPSTGPNNSVQEIAKSPSSASSVVGNHRTVPLNESPGYFILGLRDDLENGDSDKEDGYTEYGGEGRGANAVKNKILLRTLTLRGRSNSHLTSDEDSSATEAPKTYQVVIYLYQPFMFTFLFEPDTPSLSSASFYRSIHHQLGPLQKPLLLSTSPEKIRQRLSQFDIYQGQSVGDSNRHPRVFEVVFDPANRTIYSSLPNIPEPGNAPQKAERQPQPSWHRLDALNVHTQLINTFIETRSRQAEVERTCKTSRGWWVLWTRLQDRRASKAFSTSESEPSVKEVFLVRRTSDYSQMGHVPRSSSGSGFFRNFGGSSITGSQAKVGTGAGAPGASGRVAEGLGLDAKRYIEALLSLNR
ncbi:hypothetical protein VTO42DRAFT_8740 [Malbranchea cinnamomea]